MSSNLKVNNILPSTGTTIAVSELRVSQVVFLLQVLVLPQILKQVQVMFIARVMNVQMLMPLV